MDIKVQAMGDYQTNCYIVTIDGKDIIIDPGVNAIRWIDSKVTNPVAILNIFWDLSTTDILTGNVVEYKPNNYYFTL